MIQKAHRVYGEVFWYGGKLKVSVTIHMHTPYIAFLLKTMFFIYLVETDIIKNSFWDTLMSFYNKQEQVQYFRWRLNHVS